MDFMPSGIFEDGWPGVFQLSENYFPEVGNCGCEWKEE